MQLHAEASGGIGDVFVGGVIGVDGLGAHECVELDEAWGCGVVFHDPGQGVEQAVLNDESRAPLRLGLLPSGQYRLEEGILGAEVMAQQRVADPDGLGDLAQGEVVEALLGEDLHGGGDDLAATALAVGVAGAAVRRGDGVGRP